MGQIFRRILLSLLLSVGGLVGTHLWYEKHRKILQVEGQEKPIARILEAGSEVQRKPIERLIWQLVSSNDILRDGDQIMTGDLSSAKLEFFATDTIVEVEPGSLITVKESEDRPVLDFLSGNLFLIDAGKEGGIELTSKGEKLGLAEAVQSLETSTDGQVRVEKTQKAKAPIAEESSAPEIIEPAQNGEVTLASLSGGEVAFRFKKSKDPSLIYELEIGDSRKKLQKVEAKLIQSSGSGDPNLVEYRTTVRPGLVYWRVVGSSPDDSSTKWFSKTQRLQVKALVAPVPLFPHDQQKFSFREDKASVQLEWANPAKFDRLMLEIAKSADLQVERMVLPVSGALRKRLRAMSEGTYYWRVTGYPLSSKEALSTPIRSFLVERYKENANLRSPSSLTDPTQGPSKLGSAAPESMKGSQPEKLREPIRLPAPQFETEFREGLISDRKGNFEIRWRPVIGASSYELELVNANGETMSRQKTQVPNHSFKELKPGKFSLRVFALAPGLDSDSSTASPPALLSIEVPGESEIAPPSFQGVELD